MGRPLLRLRHSDAFSPVRMRISVHVARFGRRRWSPQSAPFGHCAAGSYRRASVVRIGEHSGTESQRVQKGSGVGPRTAAAAIDCRRARRMMPVMAMLIMKVVGLVVCLRSQPGKVVLEFATCARMRRSMSHTVMSPS